MRSFTCHKHLLRKDLFFYPKSLLNASVKLFYCVQELSDYVITFPGAAHSVVKTGRTFNLAINTIIPGDLGYLPEFQDIRCDESMSVKISCNSRSN